MDIVDLVSPENNIDSMPTKGGGEGLQSTSCSTIIESEHYTCITIDPSRRYIYPSSPSQCGNES